MEVLIVIKTTEMTRMAMIDDGNDGDGDDVDDNDNGNDGDCDDVDDNDDQFFCFCPWCLC